MSRPARTVAALSAAAAACSVIAVSACSASDPLAQKSASQVLSAALNGTRNAQAVTLTGVEAGGKNTLDVSYEPNGCEGKFSIAGQGSLGILMIGNDMWVQPGSTFLQQEEAKGEISAAGAAAEQGKYVKIPAGSAGSAADMCNLKAFTGDMHLPTSGLSKGQPVTIDGQQAIPVRQGKIVIDVSDTASPRILQVTGENNHFRFVYGSPKPLSPPAAGQIASDPQPGA